MSKHYSILREPRFGLDRVVFGPGVHEVIAPEVKATLKELGVLRWLDQAYTAGSKTNSAGERTKEFVTALVNCTRFTPGIVNHSEVLRLIKQHLPEFAPTVVPAVGEGTHAAGADKNL